MSERKLRSLRLTDEEYELLKQYRDWLRNNEQTTYYQRILEKLNKLQETTQRLIDYHGLD